MIRLAEEKDIEKITRTYTELLQYEEANGYGCKIVEYAKEYALSNGCSVIRIDTYVHNEPAKKLYLKNGFRIAGYGKIKLQGLIDEEQIYLECML